MGVIQGLVSLAGRLLLCTIFLTSAVGNKILNFNGVAQFMAAEGVPAPKVMLVGAIAFLLLGSASVILGYKTRLGALLLLIFLVLATYFFHDFWTLDDPAAQREQIVQFLKNAGLAGAMLFLIANGGGAWSIDRCKKELPAPIEAESP